MGKKKDKTKKVKGADKTALKTEKKADRKLKKELLEKGEVSRINYSAQTRRKLQCCAPIKDFHD